VPAVKVAREPDDLAPAGECARHRQRQMRRLGSGHREPHSLRGWNQALDLLAPRSFLGEIIAGGCSGLSNAGSLISDEAGSEGGRLTRQGLRP
jgi:hypothetical protein